MGSPMADVLRSAVSAILHSASLTAFIIAALVAIPALWRPVRRKLIKSHQGRPLSLTSASAWVLVALAALAVVLWVGLGWLLGDNWAWDLEATDATRYAVTRMVLYIGAGVAGIIGILVAYRRQQNLEEGHFLERLAESARQLGDQNPTVQAAGVYALAGLADKSSIDRRQQCVDVLCAYIRLPYLKLVEGSSEDMLNATEKIIRTQTKSEDTETVQEEQTIALRPHDRETRQTILKVISQHLQEVSRISWSSLDFDFSNAIFDGGDFSNAVFRGKVDFRGAKFPEGSVTFSGARFINSHINFKWARFGGATVSFPGTVFTGTSVNFRGARFDGGVVDLRAAELNSGLFDFKGAYFDGGTVNFFGTNFAGVTATFENAKFRDGRLKFERAEFTGGAVKFDDADFTGATANFTRASFDGTNVTFRKTSFVRQSLFFRSLKSCTVPPRGPWTGINLEGKFPDEWPCAN